MVRFRGESTHVEDILILQKSTKRAATFYRIRNPNCNYIYLFMLYNILKKTILLEFRQNMPNHNTLNKTMILLVFIF